MFLAFLAAGCIMVAKEKSMILPKLDKNFYPMIAALADYEASLKGKRSRVPPTA